MSATHSTKPRRRAAKKTFDPDLIRGLMIASGLSREGVLKNLRTGSRPRNYLVRAAWDAEMARQEKGAAHV